MEFIKKIKGLDLNLLAVFLAIDEARHITKASKVLGITQPALSHALNRLRLMFEDQLFVKSSQGMVPTPKAKLLAVPIKKMLIEFEREIFGVENFDLKSVKKTFRIFSTDLIETLLMPNLIKSIELEAPGIQLVSQTLPFALPKDDLELGKCDVAIAGFFGELPDGFYQQKLFTDKFVSAVRKSHPRLGKKQRVSINEYCHENHLLIAPGGELKSQIDSILFKAKQKRNISCGLNGFMSSAWVLAESDSILTAPSRLMSQISKYFEIKEFESPISIPGISIVQVWHARNNDDPSHRWLRGKIKSILHAN